MQYDTTFAVNYLTERDVPVRDIIESLLGVEAVLTETASFLPRVLPGLNVEHLEIKVRQIAQQSPLRELFLVSLIMAFQKDLEAEVPSLITAVTGYSIPAQFDVIVTVVALIIVFYGVGAIKDVVIGVADEGPSQRQLNGLISELAQLSGTSERVIRDRLEDRYGEKPAWKRLIKATGRFFRPSKRQNSAPLVVNERLLDHDTIRDVPADYLVDAALDVDPFQSFSNVELELHAQDKDHAGKGWAAIAVGVADKRLPLKLMTGVTAPSLWGRDRVKGDITVLYERVGVEMKPKAIHLHRITP